MEVIVCASFQNELTTELSDKISLYVTANLISVFSFKSFFDLMRSKVAGHIIIVFMISSLEELDHLSANRQHLKNATYVFILIEDNPSMISTALSLYPRYIAFIQDGFDDVCMVLAKLIQQHNL